MEIIRRERHFNGEYNAYYEVRINTETGERTIKEIEKPVNK